MRSFGVGVYLFSVQTVGGQSACIRILTKDAMGAGRPSEKAVFIGEDVADFCQHFPIQKLQKYVTPDGCDGRKEWYGTQGLCI